MNVQNALKSSSANTAIGCHEQLVPAAVVAAEFGITRRTLGRWFINPNLGFPKPIEINKHLYFRREELEAWKAGLSAPMDSKQSSMIAAPIMAG